MMVTIEDFREGRGGGGEGARDVLWNCSECPTLVFKDGFAVWFGHTVLE
jgi:hypothetical protein